MWELSYEHIESWLDAQDDVTVAFVFAALEVPHNVGLSTGRLLMDTVTGSSVRARRNSGLPSSGNSEVRILFAFDPTRQAVMLLAGDKSRSKMHDPKEYLKKRDITKEQMDRARDVTRTHVTTYVLREARSEGDTTQVQLAQAIGASQNPEPYITY